MDALARLLDLADRLKEQGVDIHHLDLGGGLGVRYKDETPPLPAEYMQKMMENERLHQYQILIEPGRAIAANAAILVSKVWSPFALRVLMVSQWPLITIRVHGLASCWLMVIKCTKFDVVKLLKNYLLAKACYRRDL